MWQLVGKLPPCTLGGQTFQVSNCHQDASIFVQKYLDSVDMINGSLLRKEWSVLIHASTCTVSMSVAYSDAKGLGIPPPFI